MIIVSNTIFHPTLIMKRFIYTMWFDHILKWNGPIYIRDSLNENYEYFKYLPRYKLMKNAFGICTSTYLILRNY